MKLWYHNPDPLPFFKWLPETFFLSSNLLMFTVMRTQGSFRLILNTKIWPGMTVDRASGKSVRITGTDGDGVRKVFLITVSAFCIFLGI